MAGEKNPLFSIRESFSDIFEDGTTANSKRKAQTPEAFSERENKMLTIIEEQQKVLNQVTASSHYLAVVLFKSTRIVGEPDAKEPQKKVVENTVVVSTQNGTLVECLDTGVLKLEPGSIIKIVMTKGDQVGIMELYEGAELPVTTGVVKLVTGPVAYIEGTDQQHTGYSVYCGKTTVKENDTVKILFGRLIVGLMDEDKSLSYSFTEKTGVSWDDIAGLENVKKQIIEDIEYPIKYASYYKAYNKKRSKGFLLYGPPGNGKTMIGKAIATSIGTIYKGEAGFIYIKGPELLNSLVGATEGRIRKLFAEAYKFYQRTGYPPILFIDEADAILPRRGSGKSSDVEKTIVPQFLAEMDGLDESAVIVVLATNRPEALDDAVIREGRVDKKIRIPRPTKEVAQAIVELNLRPLEKNKKLAQPLKEIATKTVEKMFSTELKLYEATVINGKRATDSIYYYHLISGAAVATIIQDAIQIALMREIFSEGKSNSGVAWTDVELAIQNSYAQYKQLDHTASILQEYLERGIQVVDLVKAEVAAKIAEATKESDKAADKTSKN